MSDDLGFWLEHWRLSALQDALTELGAVGPIDLLDLDDEDVESLGLKKLEMKRWLAGIEDLKKEQAKKGPQTSPMKALAARQRDNDEENESINSPNTSPRSQDFEVSAISSQGFDSGGGEGQSNNHRRMPASLCESTIYGEPGDRTEHFVALEMAQDLAQDLANESDHMNAHVSDEDENDIETEKQHRQVGQITNEEEVAEMQGTEEQEETPIEYLESFIDENDAKFFNQMNDHLDDNEVNKEEGNELIDEPQEDDEFIEPQVLNNKFLEAVSKNTTEEDSHSEENQMNNGHDDEKVDDDDGHTRKIDVKDRENNQEESSENVNMFSDHQNELMGTQPSLDEKEHQLNHHNSDSDIESTTTSSSIDSSSTSSTNIQSGNLSLKERGFLGLGDSWTERHFIFDSFKQSLTCYQKAMSSKHKKSIAKLGDVLWVKTVNEVHLLHGSNSVGKRPFRFDVIATNGEVIALSGSSENDVNSWVSAVRNSTSKKCSIDVIDVDTDDDRFLEKEVEEEKTPVVVVEVESMVIEKEEQKEEPFDPIDVSGDVSEDAIEVFDTTHVYSGDLSHISEVDSRMEISTSVIEVPKTIVEQEEEVDPSDVDDNGVEGHTQQSHQVEEEDRQIEAQAQVEEERQIEAQRQAQVEEERQIEAQRQAQAEEERQIEAQCQAQVEEERQIEAQRQAQAEDERQIEAQRQAQAEEERKNQLTRQQADQAHREEQLRRQRLQMEQEKLDQVQLELEQQQHQENQQESCEAPPPPPPAEEISILIASNDERLIPFGPEIEYNGRDAFEFGAVGTNIAPLDGRGSNVETSPLATFHFQHVSMYNEQGFGQLAYEHTSQLIEQLIMDREVRGLGLNSSRMNSSGGSTAGFGGPRKSSLTHHVNSTNNKGGELTEMFKRRSSTNILQQQSQDSPETARRKLNEQEATRRASGAAPESSELGAVLTKLKSKASMTSLASSEGGGRDSKNSDGSNDDEEVTAVWSRALKRGSSVEIIPAGRVDKSGEEEKATNLWKEALLKKEKKRLEKEAAEAAAAAEEEERLRREEESNMSPIRDDDSTKSKVPLNSTRKVIPMGAVARAKAKFLDLRKAEEIAVETAKQAAKRLEMEALEKAAEEEARIIAEREAERLRQEAEEAALPELERKFRRRERAKAEAKREYEEAKAKAQAEHEAKLQRQAELEQRIANGEVMNNNDEVDDELPNGGGLKRRQSSKMKDLLNQYSAPNTSSPERRPNGDQSLIEDAEDSWSQNNSNEEEDDDIPTIFIVSDHEKLIPFGPIICYNGQDAFEINAVGSVVALLDAHSGDASVGRYVLNVRSGFTPEELISAEENTEELANRLDRQQQDRSSFQMTTDDDVSELSEIRQEVEQEVPVVKKERPAPVARPDTRRRRSGSVKAFAMKKGVNDYILAVASNGLEAVDFTSDAIFQMKSDEKMTALAEAIRSPSCALSSLKLKDCNIGDHAVATLAKVLATNKTITDLDLSSNVIKADGAVALAEGLATNTALETVDLMEMPLLGKSERVLRAFMAMYETNFTLTKIKWRLNHPLANTLSSLLTRNNVIVRKRKEAQLLDGNGEEQEIPKQVQNKQQQEGPSLITASPKQPLPIVTPTPPTVSNEIKPQSSLSNDIAPPVPKAKSSDSKPAQANNGEMERQEATPLWGSASTTVLAARPSVQDPPQSLSKHDEDLSFTKDKNELRKEDERLKAPTKSVGEFSTSRVSILPQSSSSTREASRRPSRQERVNKVREAFEQKKKMDNSAAIPLGLRGRNFSTNSPPKGVSHDNSIGQKEDMSQPREVKIRNPTLDPPSSSSTTSHQIISPKRDLHRSASTSSILLPSKSLLLNQSLEQDSLENVNSSSSHKSRDEGDMLNVEGLKPFEFLELQRLRLEQKKQKRLEFLKNLENDAQDSSSQSKATSESKPTSAKAQSKPPIGVDKKASGKSVGSKPISGAKVHNNSSPSRLTRIGELTADGRPLERISTRPMTPVQPFVAETKDDVKPRIGHQDSDLDDDDGNEVLMTMHSPPMTEKTTVPFQPMNLFGDSSTSRVNSNISSSSPFKSPKSPKHQSSSSPLKTNNLLKAYSNLELKWSSDVASNPNPNITDSPSSNHMVRSSSNASSTTSTPSARSRKRPEELVGGEDEEDMISTIFLISDDDRLKPFGNCYCFNGRDSFKFADELTIQTLMDAGEEADDSEGVFYIYPSNVFSPEQLAQALEHTEFLIAHLRDVQMTQSVEDSEILENFDEELNGEHEQNKQGDVINEDDIEDVEDSGIMDDDVVEDEGELSSSKSHRQLDENSRETNNNNSVDDDEFIGDRGINSKPPMLKRSLASQLSFHGEEKTEMEMTLCGSDKLGKEAERAWQKLLSEIDIDLNDDVWWLSCQHLTAYTSSNPLVNAALHQICQSGVPPSRRRAIWRLWSGADEVRGHYREQAAETGWVAYEELSKEPGDPTEDPLDSACLRLIQEDIPQTCSDLYFFKYGDGSKICRRLCIALARFLVIFNEMHDDDQRHNNDEQEEHSRLPCKEYGTGMSNIAAFVLLTYVGTIDDTATSSENLLACLEEIEEDAFWTLTALITKRIGGYFNDNCNDLQNDSLLLEMAVDKYADALISVHLKSLEFDWSLLTSEWFLNLFFDSVPPYVSLHIWDLVFQNKGSPIHILVYIVLGLIEISSGIIQTCSTIQEVIILLRAAALDLGNLDEVFQANEGLSLDILLAQMPTLYERVREVNADM